MTAVREVGLVDSVHDPDVPGLGLGACARHVDKDLLAWVQGTITILICKVNCESGLGS